MEKKEYTVFCNFDILVGDFSCVFLLCCFHSFFYRCDELSMKSIAMKSTKEQTGQKEEEKSG